MIKSVTQIIIIVTLMLFGTYKTTASGLDIVTTLPSLASITKSIGGEYVEVYSITRGVQDAHYIEPKPSYMVKLNKADLLIYSGLELEIGWLPLLIQGARNEDVTVGSRGNLNAASAINLENILEKPRGEVDRIMGDVHPSGNPHYLLNPYNGIKVAELISQRLIELDPEHKKVYQNNLENFKKELTKNIVELENKASLCKGMNVVCYHRHWSYLTGWLNIIIAGYVELRPGIPPTPKHKQEIIRLMNENNIKSVIISSWKEPTKAREVANEVGAQLLILPGEVQAIEGADNYIHWIKYLVDKIVESRKISM